MCSDNCELKSVPKDYVTKKDVQQDVFLQRYPKYDGRGLFIAIIDSIIDVSLDGMQKTTTGLPKIVDCFDFSGTSDVDTSMVKKSGDNNSLLLLSGKEIKIPQNWKNPSNEWHLGIKSLKEMQRQSDNKDEEKENRFEENGINIANLKEAVKNLNFIEETNDYVDCIVWNNGRKWCACIISTFSEDLKNLKILTNFWDKHEFCIISDNMSCCVNIENDGNLLQLFIPYHDHGSLVAQVAAAHFPGHPGKDGLAPGAQIISMNVSNEQCKTENMIKALNKCIELDVDIVNLSTGRKSSWESEIINLLKVMVNEHGIVIILAAGNFGPFISSVRGDTINNADEMFTIGSIFTSTIRSLIGKEDDKSPARLSIDSSKGPLPNGARGVTLVAPGYACVQNPKNKSKKQIIYGTSCASPYAAGAIACLLTALKANSIKYTPGMIKMVLSNTAFLPDGESQLGFGNGIIQINSAFEYFKNFKTYLMQISLPQKSITKSNKKGIIFYKLYNNIFNYRIKIENDQKETPWILKLTPEKSHKHIEYPKTVTNNLFNVKIDAKKLKPGNIYYSEIHGFDPSNISMGPIFHFPITIIVPEIVINNYITRKIFVTSPSMFNLFIHPNKYCKKCTIKLYDPEDATITYFEKTINKLDFENVYDIYLERYFSTFCPSQTSGQWMIKIRWEKFLEIYIFRPYITDTGSVLKSNLEMYFEE